MTPFYDLVSGGREGKFYRVIVLRVNAACCHLVKCVKPVCPGLKPSLLFPKVLFPPTEPRIYFLENVLEVLMDASDLSRNACGVSILFPRRSWKTIFTTLSSVVKVSTQWRPGKCRNTFAWRSSLSS